MKDISKIKLFFVAGLTAFNSALGSLAVPFYILVGTNVADYNTGIVAAVCRGERVSSDVGFRGIAKKVCMWLLVAVGFVLDWSIAYMGQTFNIQVGVKGLVSSAVVFWLLANELISMLENINDIGTPLPPFLVKLVEFVRDKSEDSVDMGKEMQYGNDRT